MSAKRRCLKREPLVAKRESRAEPVAEREFPVAERESRAEPVVEPVDPSAKRNVRAFMQFLWRGFKYHSCVNCVLIIMSCRSINFGSS